MKSNTSTAIALTLLMLVLVLAAAVFFLIQGQQAIKNDLHSANDQVRAVEKQQADIELRSSAAQATLDTLEIRSTASAAENVGLTEQLANSDQLDLTREAQDTQLKTDLDHANATVQAFESQAPLVAIVNPPVDDELVAGQPVELVIVASDHAGVNSIDFNIGNDLLLLGGPVEDAGLTAVKRHMWTPDGEGPVEIRITATNINGISSEHTVSLIVIAAVTPTPEATVETLPEATPDS